MHEELVCHKKKQKKGRQDEKNEKYSKKNLEIKIISFSSLLLIEKIPRHSLGEKKTSGKIHTIITPIIMIM